jgi:hypothetical protein
MKAVNCPALGRAGKVLAHIQSERVVGAHGGGSSAALVLMA